MVVFQLRSRITEQEMEDGMLEDTKEALGKVREGL